MRKLKNRLLTPLVFAGSAIFLLVIVGVVFFSFILILKAVLTMICKWGENA